jgi:hypothetical protein
MCPSLISFFFIVPIFGRLGEGVGVTAYYSRGYGF